MSLDLARVPKTGRTTFTFFAASMSPALRHFLTEQGVEDFEILHAARAREKYGVVPSGPVKLTDGSPRNERNIACLVSDFDPEPMGALIRLMPSDEAYCQWADTASNAAVGLMKQAGDWDLS